MIINTVLKIIQFLWIFPCIFSYLSTIFSMIPYNNLKLLKYHILKKIVFKIQPERFFNLFLIYGEKFSLVSYKLVSYKKKRVLDV